MLAKRLHFSAEMLAEGSKGWYYSEKLVSKLHHGELVALAHLDIGPVVLFRNLGGTRQGLRELIKVNLILPP